MKVRTASMIVAAFCSFAACANEKHSLADGMCTEAFKAWGFEVEECKGCELVEQLNMRDHVVVKLNSALPAALLGLTKLPMGDGHPKILIQSLTIEPLDVMRTLKHEVGHVLFMQHSEDPKSLMYHAEVREGTGNPTPMEVLTAHLLNDGRKFTCAISF